MKVMHTRPSDLTEEILVKSAGCRLDTVIMPSGLPGRNYGTSEAYISDKKVGNRYSLAVYAQSDIDTHHTLYLVDMEECVAVRIKMHTVSTPACYWGRIEILDLEECDDSSVIIKYQISKNTYREACEFREHYKLSPKKEVKENIAIKLIKLE